MSFFDEWKDRKISILFVAMLTHPGIFAVVVEFCQFEDLERWGIEVKRKGGI